MNLIHKKNVRFSLGNILLFNLESEIYSLHDFHGILVSFILRILIYCIEVMVCYILYVHRIKLTTQKDVQ